MAAPSGGAALQAPAAPANAGSNVSSTGGDAGAGGATGTAPALAIPGAQPTSSGGLSVSPSQRLAAMSGVAEVASAKPAMPDGPAPKVSASFNGPAEVKVGDEFTVSLQLDSDQPVARARTQVRWDASAFQLLGGDPGSGVPEASNAKVIGRPGGAQLDINSADDPMPGGAELLVLKFKAVQARPNTAIAGQVSVLAGSGAIVGSSTPAPLTVTVAN
jgi:general secretion pathway protein D